MVTWSAMRDLVNSEVVRQERRRCIVNYLLKEIGPKNAAAIIRVFPDTSKDEIAAMARLGMIKHVGKGLYTVFKD